MATPTVGSDTRETRRYSLECGEEAQGAPHSRGAGSGPGGSSSLDSSSLSSLERRTTRRLATGARARVRPPSPLCDSYSEERL